MCDIEIAITPWLSEIFNILISRFLLGTKIKEKFMETPYSPLHRHRA